MEVWVKKVFGLGEQASNSSENFGIKFEDVNLVDDQDVLYGDSYGNNYGNP